MTTLTVTTLSDSTGHSGLSLRDALTLANSSSTGDVIVFQAGLAGTITLEQGQLTVANSVTISGDTNGDKHADITISGNSANRIFDVTAGTSTFDALVLRDGVSTAGGAIRLKQGATLTVDHSTITSNQTIDAGPGDWSRGGGIDSYGTLTLKNTTVEQNTAYDHGGGVHNGGTFTAINSTFNDNSTSGFGGGVLSDGVSFNATNITVSGNTATVGGGIVNEATFIANNITVTGNSSGPYGSGVFNSGHLFAVHNSIILGNGPGGINGELFGTVSATGVNIIGSGSDTNSGDGIINASSVEAVFGNYSLADNGGPVQTIMLVAGSNPAVDAASGSGIPVTDARGVFRTGVADLGAVERVSVVVLDPTPDPTPAPQPDPQPDPTPAPTPTPVPEPSALNVVKGTTRLDVLDGLAGRDAIYAYAGQDIVRGHSGDDRLLGGLGNDRLYGDYGDDSVLGGLGSDRVSGGAGNDKLYGQSGNDLLNGGLGDDRLTGGYGNDRFAFSNLWSKDTITDFNTIYDRIYLNHNVFAGLLEGRLNEPELGFGTAAQDDHVRITYNSATGDLSFDEDGSGAIEAVTFAKLGVGLFLTADDFFIY